MARASTRDQAREERARAFLRIGFGAAQLLGATMSGVLLLETGVTRWSLLAVILTCVLTTVSVLVFGDRRRGRE